MPEKLPFLSGHRRLVHPKGEPSEDALVQERFQRHQVIQQQGISLRMPPGQILAKQVVVVIARSRFRKTVHRPRLLHNVQHRINNGVNRCQTRGQSKRGHQEKRPRCPTVSRPLSDARPASSTPLVDLPLGELFRPASAACRWSNHHTSADRAGVRVSSFLEKSCVQVTTGVAQAGGNRARTNLGHWGARFQPCNPSETHHPVLFAS